VKLLVFIPGQAINPAKTAQKFFENLKFHRSVLERLHLDNRRSDVLTVTEMAEFGRD
jgi:hypothetical protein